MSLIEIKNVYPVNKGSLLCTCDVRVIPWKYTFYEVKVFEKGQRRWINMPEKERDVGGEIKYKPMGGFDSDQLTNQFKNQAMAAIDKYLDANPDLKAPDTITEDQEIDWSTMGEPKF